VHDETSTGHRVQPRSPDSRAALDRGPSNYRPGSGRSPDESGVIYSGQGTRAEQGREALKTPEESPRRDAPIIPLARTPASVRALPLIEIVRHTQRNVKRWRDGDMRKRWTAAGMLVAEQQFRRIIGYRDLAKLVIAIERHTMLDANKNIDRQEIAEPVTV
jgi:hypothetical protein